MAFRGELIKTWRVKNGLTQTRAAEKIGIRQGYWRELENNIKQPSVDTLALISKATGISVDDLLGNPTQPLPAQKTEQGSANTTA